MAHYMTSDELIKSVKRRISAPSSQNLFQDEDILAFADEETALGLVPTVLRLHEDYLLYSINVPLVDNQNRYEIPYRSIGNRLNEVSFRSTTGDITEMTRIEIADLPAYNNISGLVNGRIVPFYVEGNEIVLLSNNVTASQGSLRMTFYMRPNSLVLLENVGVITGIDRNTGVINLSSLPSGFTANKLYDFIQLKSPHKIITYDIAPSSVDTASKSVTFAAADIPSNLAIGDHLCLATECAIPQVPSDLHVMLAHRVAARLLEAMGDMEGLSAANQKLAEFEAKSESVIDNRVEGSPRKVVNRYGHVRRGLNSRLHRIRR
jgi:hypothetical protein